MDYLFDGTYLGLLTCVFDSFERKENQITLFEERNYVEQLFSEKHTVYTEEYKAKRVYQGLIRQIGQVGEHDFFRAFLSENPVVWNAILRLIQRVFREHVDFLQNYGDPDVVLFSETLHKIHRESHRMQAFIRFQRSNDNLYTALIEPDFNVLPLILTFFKNRYADQNWLIYDVKRNYGFLYNQVNIEEVILQSSKKNSNHSIGKVIQLSEDELLYQQLWRRYFTSTTIAERKNLKLHIQWVPKRYWKYLTEKMI